MIARLFQQLSQAFPPKPGFTEKELGQLDGKTYIVTGSNTGVGKELARLLYSKNANVYVAARSQEKSLAAIQDIKKAAPDSAGALTYLRLDLADLTTIKATTDEFLAKERKLHVLFNNAGVLASPGTTTAQGYEMNLGTNNVGTFMFTKLLTPTLVSTAASEPPGSVRVVWVSSSAADMISPKPGGVDMDNLDYHKSASQIFKYGTSKAGNYLHATEFAKRYRASGVVSVPLNPGNLDSDLYRSQPSLASFFLRHTILYPNVYGAYAELFAGLSPQVTLEKSGQWVVPWGRFMPIRKDVYDASKSKAEGGTGLAETFWQWSEDQIKPYL